MHEMSIVAGIIDLVQQKVIEHGARKVDRIHLEVGELASVDMGALRFAWANGTKDTILESSDCVIDHVPGMAECKHCHETYRVGSLYEACPHCGMFAYDIIQGRDFLVRSIEVN